MTLPRAGWVKLRYDPRWDETEDTMLDVVTDNGVEATRGQALAVRGALLDCTAALRALKTPLAWRTLELLDFAWMAADVTDLRREEEELSSKQRAIEARDDLEAFINREQP